MKKKHTLLCTYLITTILCTSGCVNLAPASTKDKDGPPLFPRSVKNIPDATPKAETKSKYGNPAFYQVAGREYRVMESNKDFEQTGMASWYGAKFHGRRTSSGEPYDMYAMTAAHPSLPLPTYLQVTNLKNGKSAIVKVNDRGPFVGDRILDLSYAAAHKLGIYQTGIGKVHITTVDPKTQTVTLAKNIPPIQPLPSPIPSDKISPGVYLQLGAFNERHHAEEIALLAQSLHDKQPVIASSARIEIHEQAANTPGNTKSAKYRVRLGPLPIDNKNHPEKMKEIVEQLALKLKDPKLPAELAKARVVIN